MNERSLYERFRDLAVQAENLLEELGGAVFHAIEHDALKAAAIKAGVDHTREPWKVIEDMGDMVVRQRDLIRELRRQVRARDRDLGACCWIPDATSEDWCRYDKGHDGGHSNEDAP